MMLQFVVWTLDRVMLIELFDALKAEGMTTWEGYWFLITMIIWLETDSAFKKLLHFVKIMVLKDVWYKAFAWLVMLCSKRISI